MRKRISLYIGDQLVDLDEQSFILFNYTMEDLTNPTIVRNSFTQQITLRGTPTNNRIFGDIFRLDRKTIYGDAYTGAYFNASRKTPFTIYDEMSNVIESGYIKLDDVVNLRGQVEYKVSLYGGLGSFFYNLMYKEDGDKMTLADMRYMSLKGYTRIAGHFGQFGGYDMLYSAWIYLDNPDEYNVEDHDNWWANIINFAPAYNGLPDNFSADKAVVEDLSFGNMVQLSPKNGASSNLMLFTNPHTEWEIKDLRWYLQRPVISLKAIFDAICDEENNGGWSVSVDEDLQNSNIYKHAWITLPLIASDDRQREDAIVKLLSSTKSPAEYVISFAKMLGLVFLCDASKKAVTILPRAKFYAGQETIDLTNRVDVKDIKVSPVLAQSRFYQFGKDAIGEWAKKYKEDYGVDYAVQRVNTGNELNNEQKIVTEGIVYKDAVEVQERSLLYVTEYDGIFQMFRLPRYESVKVQQWGVDEEGKEVMSEENIESNYEWSLYFDDFDYPLSDWLPKAQFHDGNKAVDGADVLLLFNGVKYTKRWTSEHRLSYRMSDDTEDMTLLNEGVPCWNFTRRKTRTLYSLPSFRRCITQADGDVSYITDSLEWGEPFARGVNATYYEADAQTIYNRYWRQYQQDRYDDDTFKMTCKVDLRGLHVGQDLMRKFFYYQGAIFVLNKIINHSLTTWDLTECEFVKVQDKINYQK